ncbi:MAG TPA: AAA family ATPase [Candidatus Acidoferrum sp.]
MVATGLWNDNHTPSETKELLEKLIPETESAGLIKDNVFTTAWILEAASLLEAYSEPFNPACGAEVSRKEGLLQKAIEKGGASIKPYPPSGYLTQLVVRTLKRRGKLDGLDNAVKDWAWAELAKQLALVQAKSKTQDAFAVAYLAMLATALTPSSLIDPQQVSIQRAAIDTFFAAQLKDGTWPLSRPLFHYPDFGNAHCYEYELLAQLLQESELWNILFGYVGELQSAAEAVASTAYRIDDNIRIWNSGHHPNQAEPESWATASVYHFFYQLDRFLAEAVRRQLFRYLELPQPRKIVPPKKAKEEFAPKTLDSTLLVAGEKTSLKSFLWDNLVKPLAGQADSIGKGKTFENTPRAAIFFGPPGTSKTVLSEKIAEFLGWPYIAIDPSHLLSKGMDGIQAEANTIFRMLEWTEQVVVLFDEFDELVRERESVEVDAFSRFLTTAMLPKLASIHKRATSVFILATNNIAGFDLAIRRQGRFDHVIQIMPPTFEAKMAKAQKWGLSKISIAEKLHNLGIDSSPGSDVAEKIGDLTFGECDDFATDLAQASDRDQALSILKKRWEHQCTLQMKVTKSRAKDLITWKKRCAEEAEHTR